MTSIPECVGVPVPECVRKGKFCLTHGSSMVRKVDKVKKWTKVKYGYANRTRAVVSWYCVTSGDTNQKNRDYAPSQYGSNGANPSEFSA